LAQVNVIMPGAHAITHAQSALLVDGQKNGAARQVRYYESPAGRGTA